MLVSSAIASHDKGVGIYRGPEFSHWTCAYMVEGEIELTANNKCHTICAPSFFLIPSHVEYEFVVTIPDVHYWCIFTPEPELSVVLNDLREIDVDELDLNKAIHDGIARSIKETLHWWNLKPPRIALANNALEKALLLRFEDKNMKSQLRDERISLTISYIKNNLQNNLHVAELARKVNISPSRFATLFKQQTNTTPAKYIEANRLELAVDLLLNSCKRISEIANTVGYENAFHFSRRFHSVYGQSPRDFRRNPERRRFEIVPHVPVPSVQL